MAEHTEYGLNACCEQVVVMDPLDLRRQTALEEKVRMFPRVVEGMTTVPPLLHGEDLGFESLPFGGHRCIQWRCVGVCKYQLRRLAWPSTARQC